MSFNTFNIAGGASTASLQHSLSSISFERDCGRAASSTSSTFDDMPPCGTPTPGHPPIPHGFGSLLGSLLDKVALNPQPLPPKEGGAGFGDGKLAASDDGDWCGTVPHKLPHFPPPPPPGPWADIVSAATGMAR